MSDVTELKEFDKIAAGMAKIQEEGNFIPNMETKEGYQASKRFVLDVTTPTRTALDKAHKTGKAYWLEGGRAIDKKKNELMDLLIEIQEPHQTAYKEFDQIEKDKKIKFEADIQAKIDVFDNYINQAFNCTSDFITSLIQECGETDTVEGFYHRSADATKARQEALDSLNESLMTAVNREAEQKREAELAEENRLRQIEIDKQQEAMRIQQEKMDAQQAEIDRIANEAAAKEQAEAVEKQRLIDEAAQAEREKQQAIEREEYAAQQAKEAAEQAKQDEINRRNEELRIEKEAAEKREANKRHNAKINNAILKVLLGNGISEKDAKTVVTLAAKRQLPNVVISY